MSTVQELYRCAGCHRELVIAVGNRSDGDKRLVVYHHTGWCPECVDVIRSLVQCTDDPSDAFIAGLVSEARAIAAEQKRLRKLELSIELRRRGMFALHEKRAG